jgi:hypothetical protein
MKNVIVVEMPKEGVAKLTSEELGDLKSWGEHPGLQVAKKLAGDFLVDKARQAISSRDMSLEDTRDLLNATANLNEALQWLFDAGERAKEELGRRGQASSN